MGSLERGVLPQARRFGELGVTADDPLPPLEPIGQLVRNTGAPSAAEPPASASPPSSAPTSTPDSASASGATPGDAAA